MADAKPRLSEFSAVTLRRRVVAQGMVMPAGSRGVIMGVYADGLACEVEFETPHVVLTVDRADLQV